MKRRRIEPGQEVILIYVTGVGYVKEPATFQMYRRIMVGNVSHDVPVFRYKNKEITGLECFWLLPENAANDDYVLDVQRRLTSLQIKAYEIAREKDYSVPEKVQDSKLKEMANENVDRMQKVIEKFGFDPRDESWLEDLAEGSREKNWFRYERENGAAFSESWDGIVAVFNEQYNDTISVDQARNMSKKRMRLHLGAYQTRMSGNANQENWSTAARAFEKVHRERENRMLTWSLLRQPNFPLVRAKKPIKFWPGPYFHQFIERCPQIFSDPKLKSVKQGTILRVISYDVEGQYIRLDFTADIRAMIKPGEAKDAKIWLKDHADYDLWLKPEEIQTHLEILEPIE